MRPDIRTARKFSDLEKPSVPAYGANIGTSGLVTDSITPDRARYDVMYWHIFDGGEIDGLTEATIGTWTPKNVDGGVM